MELWVQSELQLLSTFPQDAQDRVMAGFSDPPRYRAALANFFDPYGCAVRPWPASSNVSFDALFADPTAPVRMYGSFLPVLYPTGN